MRTISIGVDLSEATRNLVDVTVKLPVKPGTVARFTTPLWIPESHIANGPVSGIANLHFSWSANNVTHELKWSRAPLAAHEYIVHIPPNVDTIYALFQSIITRNVTRRLILFGWEHVLLYPISTAEEQNGSGSRFNLNKLPIRAAVRVPSVWGVATALENLGIPKLELDGTITKYSYGPTTVRGLADSPILAAPRYSFHLIDQAERSKRSEEVLCIAADGDEYIDIPAIIDRLSRIIDQVQLLFGGGPPPYALDPAQRPRYYFLVALTSHLPNVGGVEHLFSAEMIAPATAFSRRLQIQSHLSLLAHEYIHCWNGKLLTPKGHNPDDFNTPLDSRLLWVYEGLTTYYEKVISVRAGAWSKRDWISELAKQVAQRVYDISRSWRSLEDLGAGTSVMRGRGSWEGWTGDREGIYTGGALVWLGVDVLLRRRTAMSRGGPKSLDDFMESFFGLPREGQDPGLRHRRTSATMTEYTLDDISLELSNICEYDWKGYFQEHVVDVMKKVDLSAINDAGYLFRWDMLPLVKEDDGDIIDFPDTMHKHRKELYEAVWNSIGLRIDDRGMIQDVRRCGPGDVARLAPQQNIVGVGDRGKATGDESIVDLICEEIARAHEDKTQPIRFLMTHQGHEWVAEINYHDGMRYPRIKRVVDSDLPDLFDDILRPLTPYQRFVNW